MTAQPATALSRTPRQSLRRARGWIVLVVILLAGSGIAAAIQLSLASTSADPMGASNPGQQGGQALARVLEQHGVHVRTASSLDEARQSASTRDDTTVLLSDPSGILDAARLRSVRGIGADLIVIAPGFTQLSTLAPDVRQAGRPSGATAEARCGLTAARSAGRIDGAQTVYRVTQPAVGCFRAGAAYALAHTHRAGATVSVVGAGLFDNADVGRAGNAALAIGLLGRHRTLVWYLPSAADAGASGPPTLAELTPGWLTPVVLLLIAVVVAAAVWRGRRFGPLVVENLPVVVRARETMEGRARLYRAASARVHALDALRVGSLRRLAALCGLPPNAHVDQIAAAAAALTGRQADDVRQVLLDARPETDAAALALASRLTELEDEVREAVRRAQ